MLVCTSECRLLCASKLVSAPNWFILHVQTDLGLDLSPASPLFWGWICSAAGELFRKYDSGIKRNVTATDKLIYGSNFVMSIGTPTSRAPEKI